MLHHDGAGQKKTPLTAKEWARWAFLGDPYAKEPIGVKSVLERLEKAFLRYSREQYFQRLIEERNIDEICSDCNGSGRKVYGSSSTWMGGIGGQTITGDVCDKCWGSGDSSKPSINLKKLLTALCNDCKEKLKEK